MRYFGLIVLSLSIISCDRAKEQQHTYDECISENMSDVKTDFAADAIRESCKNKFSDDSNNVKKPEYWELKKIVDSRDSSNVGIITGVSLEGTASLTIQCAQSAKGSPTYEFNAFINRRNPTTGKLIKKNGDYGIFAGAESNSIRLSDIDAKMIRSTLLHLKNTENLDLGGGVVNFRVDNFKEKWIEAQKWCSKKADIANLRPPFLQPQ